MPIESETHPAGYPWRERFPGARELNLSEGSAVYGAEADGAFWIITDEGTVADLLPEDERANLIRIDRYEDEESWRRARVAAASGAFNVRVEDLLLRYLDQMPTVILARPEAQALGRINERDHLQPWSRDWLRDNLPRGHRTELRTAEKLHFPEHFPRVGDVDIVLHEPRATPAFLELKGGASHDALGDCTWDLVKLSVCLLWAACSSGYLVAATLAQWFEEGRAGTELLADGEWSVGRIRERYASWFRAYEKRGDPEPRKVPLSGRTSLLGAAEFELGDAEWSLRVARVEVTDHDVFDWKPLLGDV